MGWIAAAVAIMVAGLLYALRAVFLVCWDTEESTTLFHRVLLSVPTAALSECSRQAEEMFSTAENGLSQALGLFQWYRPAAALAVREGKEKLDQYEENLKDYLTQIPGCNLSEDEVRQRVKLNLTIGNIHSLGTCAVKLKKLAEKGREKEIELTEMDRRDLLVVTEAIMELLRLLAEDYRDGTQKNASQMQALRKVLTDLLLQMKTGVVVCLKNGTITPDVCYILSCVYMDCEDVMEVVQMIQSGIARTVRSQKQKKRKEEWSDGEADQAAIARYAIKYSI